MEGVRDVFLSHSWADKTFARRLAADIETQQWQGRNLTVWLDEGELRSGSVPGQINAGLEHSRFIALVLSPNYFASRSGWTDAEWHAALHLDPDNRRGRLLPICSMDCPYVPPLLAHLMRWDLRGNNYSRDLERLIAVIREEPLPRPGMQRGRIIEEGGSVARRSIVAEQVPSGSEADDIDERLSCNLLPVESLPNQVFMARLQLHYSKPEKTGGRLTKATVNERIQRAARSQRRSVRRIPAYRLLGQNEIVSFDDVMRSNSPFRYVVAANSVKKVPVTELLRTDDGRKLLISLLNMALERHCWSLGLLSDYQGRVRFYFGKQGDGKERTVKWLPNKRTSTKTVAKPLDKNDQNGRWIHHGAYLEICDLAGRFFLKVRSTWLITADGKTPKGGPDVGRIIIKWTGQERNLSILYDVKRWSTLLARGQSQIFIKAGQQRIELSPIPAQIRLSKGIAHDQKDLESMLDAHATIEGSLSDDLIRSAMEYAKFEDVEGSDEELNGTENNDGDDTLPLEPTANQVRP